MKQIIFLSIYFLIYISCKNKEVLANESINVSITPRICGGEDADIKEHSHIVSIRLRGIFACGACTVSDKDIFSSAHCFTHNPDMVAPYLDVTVHSGTNSILELGRVHEIDGVTIHPEWVGTWETSMLHDIAHIKLKETSKIIFDEYRSKAEMPRRDVVTGTQGTVFGWGRTHPDSNIPSARLQMLEMWIMDYKECKPYMHRKLYKEQLCAYHSVGHGCASGDSGGPLLIRNVFTGIFSWITKGSCGTGGAEVFTNVFQEKEFIDSVMQSNPGGASSSRPQQHSPSQPEDQDKSSKGKKKFNWFRKITCTAAK